MTRHSADQMRFDPRRRTPFRRFNAGDDSVRVLLVAIHHGPQPAAFLGSHHLQRLQVLLAPPGEEIDSDPLNAMARATRRLLPQSPPEGGTQYASVHCLKTTIPEQWVKPWEFQVSREEALYDMRADAASSSAPFAFIRDLKSRFGHRQAWRKWQALLAGKSLDEQLWAVRPPRGMIASQAIRDWARQTLEQAGYDARMMLAEWEIFWRCKGL